MSEAIDFISKHYSWFLSGLGVFLLGGVLTLLKRLLTGREERKENHPPQGRRVVGGTYNEVTVSGNVTGPVVNIISGNSNVVTTIVEGIGKREFNRSESDRYKDLARAKVQLWGERLNRERRWDWDLLGHAIDHYVDAIRRDADNQHPWTNLAYVLHLVGERNRAYQCLQRSFELAEPGPNHPGNNYKQVKEAIDTDSYLSGGKVSRMELPSWFWKKHGRLPVR